MASKVPKAREMLEHAMTLSDITEIKLIIQRALPLMTRAEYFRQPSPVTSKRVTPRMMREVTAMVIQNPEMSYVEIARIFGINPGRVSEIVNGLRDPKTGDLL